MENYERKIDTKLILSIVATGIMAFTGVVVETAMNITFPQLMKEFHVSISTVQWMTTGYLLILSIIIPTSAFLKKRFTAKSLFISAELFFIAGITLDAIAPSFSILLAGRILQGLGGGIALPLMFNIVLEQVPLDNLGTMMGVATLVITISPAVGPSFGGLIINYWGWRMIFIILLPLLATTLLIGIFTIRQITKPQKTPFDWFGFIFLSIVFTGLIVAISNAGSFGWADARVSGSFLVCVLALWIFYRHSRKNPHPIFHLFVFRIKPFTLSILVVGIVAFICLGLGFLIPNYSQLVSSESPLTAGFLLLPGCIICAFLAPISGRALDRFGAKWPILAGNCCIILATLLYSFLADRLTTMLFITIYMIFAVGQGFSSGNSITNGIRQLPENLITDGNAICNTVQQLSGAVGTSIVTTMVSAGQKKLPNHPGAGIMLGSRDALVLLCILGCVALICSLNVFHGIEHSHAVRDRA